jgi:chemotaxis receptor (MCP) glutamine deamidase CheD
MEPGELHIAREPAIILTALGACIGITFWSATWISRFDSSPGSSDQLDVSRREVHVKVFGGAEVVGSERPQSRRSAK